MAFAAVPSPSSVDLLSPRPVPECIAPPFVFAACHCGNLLNDRTRPRINNGKWGQKCVKLGQRLGPVTYAS